MEQPKKEFLPVLQGVKLSKTQDPTIAENRKRMKSHSLCLSHRFYKVCYAVNQTYCILCPGLAMLGNVVISKNFLRTRKIMVMI